ncbi:S46 family peptidase [Cryomorphaceae bacterium 1068]|nr:S46 family peptidase [Cryomorphaceae bacterium 1068]
MSIRYRILLLPVLFLFATASAHEGMWVPSTLAKLVIDDMHDAGLKLSAEEIYSINQSSLKDAIVLFGGGCTAEVISEEGLILTNHHCGYGQIQYHSSLENDYLKNGFWAMDRSEELTNPGLTATFVVRIEDVTETMMEAAGALEGMERNAALAAEAKRLEQIATNGTQYGAEVKPFFYGNAYYMTVTETFNDVRLVGAPPSAIGKFGGDTDNWEWPRHTGDFSLFRIYASPYNKPADYSEENIPYKPKASLEIDMSGVEPGEFTMVFGFPGTTYQYLTSDAVDYVTNVQNPVRLAMREASLGVIDAAMEASDANRIKYAAKQSRISNGYKKWIGQNMGLERFRALDKKKEQEAEFLKRLSESNDKEYSDLLDRVSALYAKNQKYQLARDYLIEYFYYGPELIRFSTNFNNLIENYDSLETAGLIEGELEKLSKSMDSFYKNYDASVDQGIFRAQSSIFITGCPEELMSPTLAQMADKSGDDWPELANEIYELSIFDNREELAELLEKSGKKISKTLAQDPFYLMAQELLDNYNEQVRSAYGLFKLQEDELMKDYVRLTMELFPEKDYWPDANSTLRLTYGKMEGSEPADGMAYKPYTTLEGIYYKYIPGDKEFDVPEKLLELYNNQDYGQYATDGELRVCILGSNHTTGGNSGSPALNAKGQLVGLNFDRTWESTMSDIMFNPEICRNIMVDAKYVLFIIDKFAGAGHLVEEMKLVYEDQVELETSESSEEPLNAK